MTHDEQLTGSARNGGAYTDAEHDGAAPTGAARPADVPLDVRTLPHAQRHATIFGLLPRLAGGQALVLSVDHDPQPLRYQLEALAPDRYAWEYLERGPEVWRIAVRRHGDAG